MYIICAADEYFIPLTYNLLEGTLMISLTLLKPTLPVGVMPTLAQLMQ